MNYIIISVISLLFFLVIGKLSVKLNLLDKPNKRKIHKNPTPYTGGLVIALIFLLIVFISDFSEKNLNNLLIGSFTIAIFGLLDDKYSLNVGSKLILQLFPIVYLVFFSEILLENLGNYPFIGNLELGSFSFVFTILSVYFLINATNYLDGLDGIVAINFLISLLSLFLFKKNLNADFSNFIIFVSIPFFVFLIFNFSLFNFKKIFLGDSGSFLVGYTLSFIMILAFTKYEVDISLISWSLSFLVYEFLSVNILRIYRNKPVFKPSMDHIHHLIFKYNNSLIKTNIFIVSIQLILIFFGYIIFRLFGDNVSAIIFILFFPIFLILRIYLLKKSILR